MPANSTDSRDSNATTLQNEPVVQDSQAAPPRRSKVRTVLLLCALSGNVFLGSLDATITATALPSISQSLDLGSSGYAWVASAYLLGAVGTMAAWAKFSDIFGRKMIILAANLVFAVGSLVCALSRDSTQILAGRVVQGMGSSGLMGLPNICISDLFGLRERGMYMSLLGAVWAIASTIAPLVGGAFSEYVTWRWIFWINLPLDGLCALGILVFLDVHNPKTPFFTGMKNIDWLGITTLAGSLLMFLLGLDFGGSTLSWDSAKVVCLIVFGVVTFGLFVTYQVFAPVPLIPMRIFRRISNVAIFAVCFFHGMSYIAAIYYLPMYFQVVLGATPMQSGVWLLALAIPLGVVAIGTGIMIKKSGRYIKHLMIVGMALMTLGVGLFIDLPTYRSWPRIIIFQILVSVGMSPEFQAPLVILQQTLPPQDIAISTSAFQLTRSVASSMSLIIGQAILQSGMRRRSSTLADDGVPSSVISEFEHGSLTNAVNSIKSLSPSEQDSVRDVFNASMHDMWIYFVCTCFVGFVCAFGVRMKNLTNDHKEFKTGIQPRQDELEEEAELEKEAGQQLPT